jgi:hypothetical protein
MNDDAAPPIDPQDPDIDLYCLHCGYNLRGLPGDPRRCPECGRLNPIGDLAVSAEAITGQLREMEATPAQCVGLSLFIVPGLLAFGTELTSSGGFDLGFVSCCIPVLIAALALWTHRAVKFRASCLGKPGWGSTLARYHLVGLSACAVVVFGIVLTTSLMDFAISRGRRSCASGMAYLLLLAILGLVVFSLMFKYGRWLQRLARGNMDALQREVAVDMAREHHRRRLMERGG